MLTLAGGNARASVAAAAGAWPGGPAGWCPTKKRLARRAPLADCDALGLASVSVESPSPVPAGGFLLA